MLPNESIIIEGLWESPKAYLVSEAAKKQPVLVITGGTREDTFFDNLAYFCPGKAIEFPAWETLPGEEIKPSPDIIGKRFEALEKLIHTKEHPILLCPLPSLLQKVLAKDQIAPLFAHWKKGSEIAFDTLPTFLTSLGYQRAAVVSDKGEFAIRGGILDIYPVSSTDPYRIEFFGDEIEAIRTFDPIGQKSIQKAQEVFLSPKDEMELLQSANQLVNIIDYLDNPIIFWDDLLAIEDIYVGLKSMPASKSIFMHDFPSLLNRFEKCTNIYCTDFHLKESFEMFGHSFKAKQYKHPFHKIEHCFELSEPIDPKLDITFLNANETEEKEVKEKISSLSLTNQIHWDRGYLSSGFCFGQKALIPNVELTKRTRIRRQKWRSTYHTPAAEFHELQAGDLVVHYHSGIGRFRGMEKHTDLKGKESEFLLLEYADQSKMFVPLSQGHLVSRYIGSKDTPPSLSQLGSKRWQKTRNSAQAQIVGYANDLLELYAKRAIDGGFIYPKDGALMQQFEEDFAYLPTIDQVNAIESIKMDMCSNKTMDRLVCGDVGYGKTEVAMRAAFKAVADGQKQVAVLVPTTVLALQHYDTFCARMSGFPINIRAVSRFQSSKEIKDTIQKVQDGGVDILIGTHRLLSKDVIFKDLGLVIIDEEQRFGVRAKEHLKKFKVGVDCLTLSATPIPRTLYMSLVSARDMSVINTPPQDRLPIKTIIAETDFEIIQNALLREFARGGKAYYIHNRVETIHGRAQKIKELVPNASIGIVHGQMDANAIDEIFHKFKHNEIDLLFATTIVENGIDVPNANTILIDRADTYGLADLYQLRGRVGRWNRAAYAYFLIPKNVNLPEIARKRLNALAEASGYGGGMKVAMRDLEIRGAGDILGVQQSGQVSQVGFHLYCKMLKRAITALKKKAPITFNEVKMEFSFDARLPDHYINEVSLRMEIYYRLGDATSFEELDALKVELIDRFGPLPDPVVWLYHLSRLRVFAAQNHFTALTFSSRSFKAEQQKGKQLDQKTMLLPKSKQTPEQIEKTCIELLRQNFSCDRLIP